MRSRSISKAAVLLSLGAVLTLTTGGCFTRTVYVPDGKAVRLREDVTAKVWVLDANGKPVPGRMTLPEGWWVLPDPGPEGDSRRAVTHLQKAAE